MLAPLASLALHAAPLLGQAGSGATPAAAIALGAVTVAVWLILSAQRHRQRQREAFADLADEPGIEPVDNPADLAQLCADLRQVFDEADSDTDEFCVEAAHCYRAQGFDVHIVRIALGRRWSAELDQGFEKVVVVCRGFEAVLPHFELMPAGFLLHRLYRDSVFPPCDAFSRRNLVLSDAPEHVRQLLCAEARELMAQNKETAIESRGDLLAFYLYSDRVQPDDLRGFLADCVTFATIVRDRALTHEAESV